MYQVQCCIPRITTAPGGVSSTEGEILWSFFRTVDIQATSIPPQYFVLSYSTTVDASQNRSQPERVGAKGKPMTRPMLPKDGKGRLRIPPRHWDDESKRDQNPMRTQSPTPLMFGLRSRRRPATKAIWQVEGGSFRRRLEEPVNGSGWR